MSGKRRDLTGMRFGKLTIIEATVNPKNNRKYWRCLCDCGNTAYAYTHSLLSGKVISCGCSRIKHGGCANGKEDRLYGVWRGMRQRCNDPHAKSYKNYGARGIGVCEEWLNNYQAFKEWAYSHGYNDSAQFYNWQIDRIDNNIGYCPSNCRFITSKQNNRNRRNTKYATINGETRPVTEWCERLGKDFNLVRERLNCGWSVEDAFYKPKQIKTRRVAND